MELSPVELVLLGLLLAGWTFGAVWLVIAAQNRARQAQVARSTARRLTRMIDDSPAVPMLVKADGKIEGPERIAAWLGLEHMPGYLSELAGEDEGLFAGELADLTEAVRKTQKTASSFRMVVTPIGSCRSLAVRAQGDFAALVGLIEAAPIPMWFRGPDMKLRLVNSAYVKAVEATDAETVVKKQVELIERVDGLTPAQIAKQARDKDLPVERIVQATVGTQRRTLRVSDLPLGGDGVAGYAIDIEEMEEQGREFRAFRDAQRSMLDQLSIGVAQFDGDRTLAFSNQSFQRIFALSAACHIDPPSFDRFLDMARDEGRLPETRDFPAWRRELGEWFSPGAAKEEAWTLSDGTHLRIVAQPMPDG